MLILLSSELLDELTSTNISNGKAITAMENIALARRDGNHLVLGDPDTIKYCATSDKLSAIARGVYHRIHSRLSTERGLLSDFNYIIEVVKSGGHLNKRNKGTQTILSIPIDYFQTSALVQPTIFLCENQVDVDLYLLFAKAWLHYKRINSNLVCDKRGGGGSNIAEEYRVVQQSRNKLCLCIVDSDRKDPNSVIGSTAKAVRNVHDTTQPLCDYSITNSREAENLVPLIAYSDVSARDPQKIRAFEFLEKVVNKGPHEILPYLDLKSGTYLRSIKSSNTAWTFWEGYLPQLSYYGSLVKSECISPDCHKCDPCESKIFLGFNDVLKDMTANLTKAGHRKLLESIHAIVSDDVLNIGETVSSWCCGSERLCAT